MNIKNFKEALPYLAQSEVTPFIWGHAGIGKSTIVKQWADSLGYKFFPFYLGTQSDLGDILGLADFVRDSDGNPVATTFAIPKWLKETIDYCEQNPDSGAVIFLDEFNRARRDILNGMFSLALDKTFHTLKLPKNCHLVAAGNPPTEEYVTTDVDETALMARFVHIKLEPTIEEWLEFAKETKIDTNLVEFIRQQPELLEEKRSEFKLPIKVDRRAYSRLNKLIALNTPAHLMQDLMIGIIGLERTVAYGEFLKSQDKPMTGEEVLKGNFKLVEKWSNPENINGSLLSITCENVLAHLKGLDEAKTMLADKEKKNLVKFFLIVPKDVSYKAIKELAINESAVFKDLCNTKDYEKQLLEIIRIAKGTKAA